MSLQFNRMFMDMSLNPCCPIILEKVFYNENILEQIFKFLPTNDLTTMRLVCSKWKSESDRMLRLRSLIVLRTKTDIQRITAVMDKQKMLGGTPLFKNFLIKFDEIHLEQEEIREFLTNHGPSFQQLGIQFNSKLPHTQNTPQSLKHLLEKQTPNLKSLQFFGLSQEQWQSGELFSDSVNLLPNLEHIGCVTVNWHYHYEACPLYLSLFNRLPSVKKITINCSNYWDILFKEAVSDGGSQLCKFFSIVEEINTGFYDNDLLSKLENLEHVQPIRVPNILKLLPHLCPKVRNLRLCFNGESISNADVANVLKSYAEQLKVLWLNVNNFTLNVNNFTDYEYDENEQQADSDDENEQQAGSDDENEQQAEARPNSLINELLTSSVFKKLRVIRTGVNVFEPPSAVPQFFHEQLPALESLALLYKVPSLAWNRDFQHSRLRNLEVIARNAECLLPIGQLFPNVKTLHIGINGDAAMQLVVQAFPNLEELDVRCYRSNLSDDGIKCIGDLQHLCHFTVRDDLTKATVDWLKQLKSLIFLNIPIYHFF